MNDLPEVSLEDLISQFSNASYDLANEYECGTMASLKAAEERIVEFEAEFLRRGLRVSHGR